jgi:hypothetical protein
VVEEETHQPCRPNFRHRRIPRGNTGRRPCLHPGLLAVARSSTLKCDKLQNCNYVGGTLTRQLCLKFLLRCLDLLTGLIQRDLFDL